MLTKSSCSVGKMKFNSLASIGKSLALAIYFRTELLRSTLLIIPQRIPLSTSCAVCGRD